MVHLAMASPIIAPPLAGNVMGSGSGSFVVAEWRDAGGPPGPPRLIAPPHVHHRDDEAWYVLEGVLRVRVGKDEVEASAGSGVFVPRGTPHNVLESGAWTGPVSAGHDLEHFSPDPGNSCDEGTNPAGAGRSIPKVRLRTSGQLTSHRGIKDRRPTAQYLMVAAETRREADPAAPAHPLRWNPGR
jgi:hypothetical protein